MSCTIGGINIEDNAAKAIMDLAEGDNLKAVQYAKAFVNTECIRAYNEFKAKRKVVNPRADTIKKFFINYLNKTAIDVDSTTDESVNDNLLGFTSVGAINTAKNISIDEIINQYKIAIENNTDLPNNQFLRNKILAKYRKGLKDVYFNILNTNNEQPKTPPVNNKSFKSMEEYVAARRKYTNDLIAEMKEYANAHDDIRMKNIVAAINQIETNYDAWFESIIRNPKLAIWVKNNKEELLANNEVDENSIETSDVIFDYDERKDNTASWADNGGETSNFMSHFSDNLITSYFQTLPEIVSAEKDANGNYILNANNELGIPTSVSYIDYIRAMKDYGDYRNRETLIASLRRAAKQNEAYKSLAIVADDISKNNDLLAKIINVFGKPVISKAIIDILGDRITMRQSNIGANAQAQLQFNMLNAIKSSAIDNASIDYRDALEKINTYYDDKDLINGDPNSIKIYKNAIINNIYNVIKDFYPEISKAAICAFVEDRSAGTLSENINTLIDFTINTVNNAQAVYVEYAKRNAVNSKIFLENIERSQMGEPPIDYVKYDTDYNAAAEETIINFTRIFTKYVAVKTEYNSRNAENNLSSDIINNNFITNLKEKVTSTEGLNAYMKFKTQGNYYDYSNILYEHKSPNGEIIYGLFRKDAQGNAVPTEYASSLLDMLLFNGAKDATMNKGILYNSMSDGDYFISSVVAFKNSISVAQRTNKETEFATYFMRTPSDAPKNFMISAPRYSYLTLFDFNLEDSKNSVRKLLNAYKSSIVTGMEARAYRTSKPSDITNDEFYTIIQNTYRDDTDISDEITYYRYRSDNKSTKPFDYVIKTAKTAAGNEVMIGMVNFNSDNQVKIDSSYNNLVENFVDNNITNDKLINNPKTKINTRSALFTAYKNLIKGEIRNAVDAYQKMFRISSTGDVELAVPEGSTEEDFLRSFQELYFYNKTVFKNGKLTGNVFDIANRSKLYRIKRKDGSSYSVGEELDSIIKELYNDSITNNINAVYDKDNNGIYINFNKYEKALDDAISKWIKELYNYSIEKYNNNYASMHNFKSGDIFDYVVNSSLMNANFDDLFEGDYMFYKNAQTFLKRTKEVQASGNPLFTDRNENLGEEIRDIYDINIGDTVIPNRNGFHAVTIRNVSVPFYQAERMFNQLRDSGVSPDTAGFIASKYGYNYYEGDKLKYVGEEITTDDAQSYITLEEFIRRATNKGELNAYKPLLEKLLDPNLDVSTLRPDEFKEFIQVQKHFYYDLQFDKENNVFFPRQIKNAEFVLVPAFIRGTDLEKVNNWMHQNGIDQVNTWETSKAANKNVIDIWNEDNTLRDLTDEDFAHLSTKVKQPYYYQFLYEQQKVPQHLINAKNKAGVQIMKKLLDNLPNTPEAKKLKELFFKLFVANIKFDHMEFMKELDIAEGDGYLNFGENFINRIYELASNEVARLGLDSNMKDYVTIENGQPIMPNFMNLVAGKVESIAQSLFNSRITRQKLPGWHAAQVSDVLFKGFLKDKDGNPRRLEYHPDVVDDEGNVTHEGYIEILIPKIASSMFNVYDEDGNLKKEIRIEDIDEDVLKGIGYRIPTEGKQSVSVVKIAGFLPDYYGSIVVLPEAWVAQTGADFDVDSVYGISYETYLGEDGRVHKVPYSDAMDEDSIRRRYNAYARRNGIKVTFNKVTKEEKDEIFDSIRARVDSVNAKDEESYLKGFEEVMAVESVVYKNLPEKDKEELKAYFADIKLANAKRADKDKIKYKQQVKTILALYKNKINEAKNEEDKIAYEDFVNVYEAIDKIINLLSDFNSQKSQRVKDLGNEKLNKLYQQAVEEYYNSIENAAVKEGLMSYEDFAKSPVEEQNSPQARNNKLLDVMITIMELPSSLEENYSSSNFKDLIDDNNYVNTIDKSEDRDRSPYNPFDQIAYMNDAVSGMKLKAFSVTRDTFNSINNVAKTELSPNFTINVTYDLSATDEQGNLIYNAAIIKHCYEDQAIIYDNGLAHVKHNKIGWNINNRNIVGKLLTPYSSQTTAHILDAIKEGAIKNENDYTFAAFKTLVDVGIDYRTAIMFLRQPAISLVVKAYNENKSVYVKGNFNPIHSAIKQLAIKNNIKYTYKNKTYSVNQYTPIDTVMWAINEQTKAGYVLDPEKKEGVNIDGVALRERFDKEEDFNADMKVLIEFNKLMQISNTITALAGVCNPDKFGAKQSIYATRRILENIYKYAKQKGIGKDLTSNGKNIIDAIYPGLEVGIDDKTYFMTSEPNDSVYPSLAAFLKYSTIPSTIINRELFVTESDSFINSVNQIASASDKKLSEKTYNAIKKYIISYAYNETNFISHPQLYSYEYGCYVPVYEDLNGPISEQTEFDRIFGYYASAGVDFHPKNINSLTKEELNQYLSLSPAQKIYFVKSHLANNDNVFAHLNVNLANYQNKSNAFTPQTITFNENDIDREDMYQLFRKAYYNYNPIVKYAIIDLIKYAFAVEGYNFKHKAVSKIIPNDILLDIKTRDNSFNFIRDIKKAVRRFNVTNKIKNDYIRANHNNSEIVNQVYVKPKNDIFGKYYLTSNIYKIPKTDRNNLVDLKVITVNDDGTIDTNYCVNITRRINKKLVSTLYAIVNNGGNDPNYYLYPINPLEENEHTEFSSNPDNNKYNIPDYYLTLISYDSNNTKDVAAFVKGRSEEYTKLYNDTKITVPKNTEKYNTAKETAVMEIESAAGKNFIKDINEQSEALNKNINDKKELVIFNNDSTLFKTIPESGTTQMIPNNGQNKYYLIAPTKIPSKVKTLLNRYDEKEHSKLTNSEKILYNRLRRALTASNNTKIDFANKDNHYYKVIPIDNPNEVKSKPDEESYSIISGVAVDDTLSPFTTIAKKFESIINRDANYRHSAIAADLVSEFRRKGIRFNSTADVNDNIEDILKAQAEYVKDSVDIILDKLNNVNYYNIPADDPSIPEKLNDELFRDFYIRLILNANNFAKSFNLVGDINYENATPEIKRSLDIIQNNINRLKNNSKAIKGIRNIMDWFANNFSTDPRIKNGFKSIIEEYGDADYADWLFSDIAELNNSSVQIIVKKVLSERYAANMKAKEYAREIRDKLQALYDTGRVNYDHFIKNGKFINDYDTQVFADYRQLLDDVEEIRKNKGTNNIEYHRADLKARRFAAEHFEKYYVKQYYLDTIDNEEEFLNTAPEYYVQYKSYQNANTELLRNSKNKELSEDDRKTYFSNTRKLAAMSNDLDPELVPGSIQYRNVKAAAKYYDTRKKLRDVYFEEKIDKHFDDNLQERLKIIAKYEGSDLNENLMKIKEYADAKEWITNNTALTLNPKFKRTYTEAIKLLKQGNEKSKNSFIPKFGDYAYDSHGKLRPELLTEEDILKAKKAQLNNYNITQAGGMSDTSLMKAVHPKLPFYDSSFYSNFPKNPDFNKNNPERLKTINEINVILSKHYDAKSDSILTSQLTLDELKELQHLYNVLEDLTVGGADGKKVYEYIKNNATTHVDLDFYNAQKQAVIDKYGAGSEYYNAWIKVNQGYKYSKTVGAKVADENIPNQQLYGYIKPKDKFINKKKTEAIEFLEAHTEYIVKDEFYSTYAKAAKEGKGEEWYEANTIVNPRTYQREPLRIWKESIIKGVTGSSSTDEVIYDPRGSQVKVVIADKYRNYNYDEEGFAYNHSDPKYNTNLELTKEEQEYIEIVRNVLNELTADNYKAHKFVLKGNLPRRRVDREVTFAQALTGVADILGYTANEDIDRSWKDNLDYAHDTNPTMPMLQKLKVKGTKRYIEKREKEENESDNDYAVYSNNIDEENKKIKEYNDNLLNKSIDHNWNEVMHDFIINAYDYNARQQSKLYLYVLMDSLGAHDAYKITSFGTIKRDYENSFEDSPAYRTEEQTRTKELLSTFMHRFIYDEYKKPSKYAKAGSIAQNVASAKYMMLNITGGIGNVLTGWNNIAMESIAKEYFTVGEWIDANNDYNASLPSYFANLGSDKADNLTDALIKLYDVVDFTQLTGQALDTKSVAGGIQVVKDIMYSPQSMGERYMQNSALIAMMKNTKVYTDINGKTSLVTYDLYVRNKEQEVFEKLINSDKYKENHVSSYNEFINRIKNNKQEGKKYNEFRKSIIPEYLRTTNDKELAKDYIAARKKALKETRKEFDKLENLKDQYVLANGYAVLKPDTKVTYEMAGEFKNRVIKVNDKIHGVYNKIGAAKIESEWWGGMVMQYHKHIYPGVLKRWRRKGMYNEARQSIEKGCYQSFFDFLTIEFNRANKDNKELNRDDKAEYLMKGLQNYAKAVFDTFTNAQLNWNLMDEWERNNVKRTLADFLTVTSALAGSVALFIMNDDDKYEDSLIWNLLVYEADKLASESMMYTPMGIMSEGKKLWSSPLAIIPSFQDGFKSLGLIANIIVNGEDFDPYYATGRYAGENKLAVYITRNIPMYRAYKRLEDLDKNNSYYKLGNNAIGFFDAEAIANAITK